MLSFDITDRNIRIIKAKENGGKVKIFSSVSVDLDDGIIVNGYVKNIPLVANLINQALKEKCIKDREAVVSISSNLIMFRELKISKTASAPMKTLVQNELHNNMNVSDEHSISYTIAGEERNGSDNQTKVLANACPRDLVDCYRHVFSLLSISLRSISASCNCISRLILSDTKIANKMPLLLVQIDPNFININVYQNSQLTFSRFASISPDDYDDKADYVFQAVNENIVRMFQFQRTRSSEPISNVIFYGNTSEFIRLTNYLDQMDVKASLLNVPSTLSGYENLEFANFANAIGAIYLNKKEYDSANLLLSEGAVSAAPTPASDQKTLTQSIGVFVASAAVVGLVYFGIFMLGQQTQNKIKQIDTYINSEQTQTKLADVDKKNVMLEKLQYYKNKVQILKNNNDTYPEIDTPLLKVIRECYGDKATMEEIGYSEGVMSVKIVSKDFTFPATFAENFYKLSNYDNIAYVGFEQKDDDKDKNGGVASKVSQEILDPVTGEVVGTIEVPVDSPYESLLTFQLRAQEVKTDDINNIKTDETADKGGEE